jgi:hypothetical protein
VSCKQPPEPATSKVSLDAPVARAIASVPLGRSVWLPYPNDQGRLPRWQASLFLSVRCYFHSLAQPPKKRPPLSPPSKSFTFLAHGSTLSRVEPAHPACCPSPPLRLLPQLKNGGGTTKRPAPAPLELSPLRATQPRTRAPDFCSLHSGLPRGALGAWAAQESIKGELHGPSTSFGNMLTRVLRWGKV